VVSRCLLGERCRYDGEVIRSAAVVRLGASVELVPVCPEVEIGLGVSREPIDVVLVAGRHCLVERSTGRDLTARMERFCRRFLETVGEVDGFVLKARSPSCGVGDAVVLDGKGEAVGSTDGLFARAVRETFGALPVVNEEQLEQGGAVERFLAAMSGPR
jgi:uncharacterized protein YbbK (DUF523 family)